MYKFVVIYILFNVCFQLIFRICYFHVLSMSQTICIQSCNLIGLNISRFQSNNALVQIIQIQMYSQQHTSPRENSSCQFDCQDSLENCQCSNDEQSQEIRAILESGRPLFVVQESRGSMRKTQSQTQMIKRKILSYNRREKSLQQLSRKFVQNFQQEKEVLLQLDKVMVQLRVERRRIYDIVNIFQSLQVIRKASKNNYIWRGLKEAVKTINNLGNSNQTHHNNHPSKNKSLQNLASRFLNIFGRYATPITLEQAAKLLINNQECTLVRTKLRRLYDIINVFKSIGIVQKVNMPNRKVGFKWIGTHELQKIIVDKSRVSYNRNEIQEIKSENKQTLNNVNNVNEWFSDEELKAFATLRFMKQYSQKIFLPSIIMHEGSRQTLTGCQLSFNDICN